MKSRPGLLLPQRLQAIVDVEASARAGWAPLDVARAFLDGGARFLQVRGKTLGSGALLRLTDEMLRVATPFDATVIVNDRVDVARLAGAAGAHVGQDDLPPADARSILGDGAMLGYSTHTEPQIELAVREPLTYLAIGPVFGTATKATGYDAIGLERVRTAARLAGPLPVVAIGGITIDTAVSVIEAGATTVAVIGDLLATGDPGSRVRAWLRRLESDL